MFSQAREKEAGEKFNKRGTRRLGMMLPMLEVAPFLPKRLATEHVSSFSLVRLSRRAENENHKERSTIDER